MLQEQKGIERKEPGGHTRERARLRGNPQVYGRQEKKRICTKSQQKERRVCKAEVMAIDVPEEIRLVDPCLTQSGDFCLQRTFERKGMVEGISTSRETCVKVCKSRAENQTCKEEGIPLDLEVGR